MCEALPGRNLDQVKGEAPLDKHVKNFGLTLVLRLSYDRYTSTQTLFSESQVIVMLARLGKIFSLVK